MSQLQLTSTTMPRQILFCNGGMYHSFSSILIKSNYVYRTMAIGIQFWQELHATIWRFKHHQSHVNDSFQWPVLRTLNVEALWQQILFPHFKHFDRTYRCNVAGMPMEPFNELRSCNTFLNLLYY